MPYAYDIWIRRVKVLLNLLFRHVLNAKGVRELDSAIAMEMLVIFVYCEYVHLTPPCDEVIDAVFDLLW